MGADANRMGLAFVEESTFGTSPGTQLKNIRYTGESLKQDTSTTTSNEIRSDRQVSDVIRTNLKASGGIDIEMSYKAHQEFIEAALLSADISAEVDVATADTGVSAAASDNSFNHTSAWDNTPAVGDWIRVEGFSTAGNNGYCRVVSATSSKIVVSFLTLTDEAATPSIDMKVGQQMTNGTTFRSFHLEKEFTDLTNEFVLYGGMCVDTMDLNIAVESIITGAFSFLGKSEEAASATSGTGTNTAAATNDIMNAVDNIQAVFENGSSSIEVTSFTMALANNLRARAKVGTLGTISVGTGTVGLTGALEVYFASAGLMTRYRNFSDSAIAIIAEDADGNGFIIDLPQIRFTDAQQVSGGINTDIMAAMQYTAFRHSTLGYTCRIVQFDV